MPVTEARAWSGGRGSFEPLGAEALPPPLLCSGPTAALGILPAPHTAAEQPRPGTAETVRHQRRAAHCRLESAKHICKALRETGFLDFGSRRWASTLSPGTSSLALRGRGRCVQNPEPLPRGCLSVLHVHAVRLSLTRSVSASLCLSVSVGLNLCVSLSYFYVHVSPVGEVTRALDV